MPTLMQDRPETSPQSQILVSTWDGHSSEVLGRVIADFNRLQRLTRHDPDFRISRRVVLESLRILSRVMSHDTVVPALVPRVNGGLQMEWHLMGVDLEISVNPDGTAFAWCEHQSGREWEDDEGLNFRRIKKELSLLVSDDD